MATDLEIARAAKLLPISEIARRAGLPEDAVFPFGRHVAKLALDQLDVLSERAVGHLILVTAINPTPPGEGKTTTTVGLGDALNRLGRRTIIALREPSLGPVFGVKGGATGGGYAQAAPMDAINLHFTGDFHAITAAHNLLAALLDNHLFWGNALDIDPRRIAWRRVVDVNDRALRKVVVGLGDDVNGAPRETGFDITVASEVMAVLCLATDLDDLKARLARIVVARRRDLSPVTAQDLQADGAMAALLRDAIQPNLVQSLEGTPILMHGGPFANIAHGCNSVIATRTAMRLADFTVTEAGFGADLGAEKFCDIACRVGGFAPDAAVIVATLRALKHQGGASLSEGASPNPRCLEAGLANLGRHIENVRKFGVPPVVGINFFSGDTEAELLRVIGYCREVHGVEAVVCRHWAQGGAGAEALARAVVAICESRPSLPTFQALYDLDASLIDKIEAVAKKVYRASRVSFTPRAQRDIDRFEAEGWGKLAVCIAKTPYSFSADPSVLGAPTDHVLPVREVRLAAGAGIVVAICGDVMTMPGLPRHPAAADIQLDSEGRVEGLF